MKIEDLKNIINQGEGISVEFKSSFNEVLIETLVAFANSKGGSVFMGIDDNGKIEGLKIGKESEAKWINEIKNKTTPILLPDIDTVEIDKKKIVIFSIKEYPYKPGSN
jgi:ATP-dependent DNA helicase RecG